MSTFAKARVLLLPCELHGAKQLFRERVKRGQVMQRRASVPAGTREDGGKTALVDLSALDGGYSEWRDYFWIPQIQAGVPPGSVRGGKHAARFGSAGGKHTPFALLQGIFQRPETQSEMI